LCTESYKELIRKEG
jgi:hypothetical protein